MTPSTNITIITTAQTGRSIQIGDCKTTFLVSQTATNGLYCVFEHDLPAGFPGPPPHAHRITTHTFYVIEGTVRIVVDGKSVELWSATRSIFRQASFIGFPIQASSGPA
ncbi:hypothetical protein GO755_28010 [Spirosoma sp. HMF4905]|uniref:Cupin domain-containing protein n=1 Tax=Spirosoma arboris TaxID=2682092 RepID=A0A7K1SJJ6_9BACT|nr:hypothetical protein [Spirosoma arboris]